MFQQNQEPGQEIKSLTPEEVDQMLIHRLEQSRELIDKNWDPEKQQPAKPTRQGLAPEEEQVDSATFAGNLLENAKVDGRRIFAGEVTLKFQIPESALFDDPSLANRNALLLKAIKDANLEERMLQMLNHSHPETVALAKQVEMNDKELNAMLTASLSDDEKAAYGGSLVTGIFDYEHAKEIYLYNARVREQFKLPDPSQGRLAKKFEDAGYPLTEAREMAEVK